MRNLLLLPLFFAAPCGALAGGPATLQFMITEVDCVSSLPEDPETGLGGYINDLNPVTENWNGAFTCFGQSEHRPAVAKEMGSLDYPGYGACQGTLTDEYPTMGQFYWKAKVLTDGRFQIFCSVEPSVVIVAPYYALGESQTEGN